MKNNIKVLHYGLTQNQGGLENVVLSWFNNKPDNIQFDFVNDCVEPLAYQDYYEKKGCKIHYVTHRYKNPIKHYNELKRIIEEGPYDYIHCHTMTMIEAEPAIIATKSKNCRAIYHCHSMYKGLDFPLKEKLLQSITKVMLIGQDYLKTACSKDAGTFMFNDSKFTVIENGIDFDKFKYINKNRKIIRDKLKIDDDCFVVGHVGHICPEKNYPFILSSFIKLVEVHENCKLLLIGNMINDVGITNEISRLDLIDKVFLTGVINNVNEYYSAMDAFYLPSINEGFPLVLVEAQTSGLQCITSKAITKDAKISDNIVFIDFDDETAVRELLKAKEKCINRKKVLINQDFDIKNSSKKMFDFYMKNLKN